MAAARSSTAIGAFVLGALALGVAAIMVFGGAQLFTPKIRMVAYFQNSVAGLTVGAPVTLRGVKIGTVSGMKVFLELPDLVPIIPVYMEIEPARVSWTNIPLNAGVTDIDMAIKVGLRAQLATTSLVTGQVTVNLDFFPGTPVALNGHSGDVPEIPTIPSDMQHIKDEIVDLNLPDLVNKARTALSGINEIIGELNGKVGPLADSVKQTSDAAQVTLNTATQAVQSLQSTATRTLDSIDRLASTTQGQVGQFTTSAGHTLAKADKVMDNLNDLTAPRSPLRDNLESAVRDLAATTAELRNFGSQIERNPSTLLLGRSSR